MFLMHTAWQIILESHSEIIVVEGISDPPLLIKMQCFNLQNQIDNSLTEENRLQTFILRQFMNDYRLNIINYNY